MKKFLIFFIVILIPVIIYAYQVGDVDGNGNISTLDYISVRNHILGNTLLTGDKFTRADANFDNKISSLDYIAIRKLIMSPSPLPKSIVAPNAKSVDLVLLWGQSNMLGSVGYSTEQADNTNLLRGIDEDIVLNNKKYGYVTVDMPSNVAFEYKYFSNSLVDISTNPQTFGETIYYNNGILSQNGTEASLNESVGTNMLPYLAKEYYEKTGNKVVYVMGARGGYDIKCFSPDSIKNTYQTIVTKYNAALNYITSNGYTVNNKFYVVYQGESDMTSDLINDYANNYKIVHDNLSSELGLKFGSLVKMVRGDGECSNFPFLESIREQQDTLINENDDIIEGTDFLYQEYCVKGNNTLFGVKHPDLDNSIHVNSAALSQVGRNISQNIVSSKKVNAIMNSQNWQKTNLNNTVVNVNKATSKVCGLPIQNGKMEYYTECNGIKTVNVENGCANISINSCNQKQTLNYYLRNDDTEIPWDSVSNIGEYLVLAGIYNQWLHPETPAFNALNHLGSHVSMCDVLSSYVKIIGEVAIQNNINDGNKIFIEKLYKAILGRDASEVEIENWINVLNIGTSRVNVLNSFIEGNEAREIYSSWGYN